MKHKPSRRDAKASLSKTLDFRTSTGSPLLLPLLSLFLPVRLVVIFLVPVDALGNTRGAVLGDRQRLARADRVPDGRRALEDGVERGESLGVEGRQRLLRRGQRRRREEDALGFSGK